MKSQVGSGTAKATVGRRVAGRDCLDTTYDYGRIVVTRAADLDAQLGTAPDDEGARR